MKQMTLTRWLDEHTGWWDSYYEHPWPEMRWGYPKAKVCFHIGALYGCIKANTMSEALQKAKAKIEASMEGGRE